MYTRAVVFGGGTYGDFQGELDEIQIWNHARTLSQIQADGDAFLTGEEVGLVHYWSFNSEDVYDAAGSGNDGILLGNAAVEIDQAAISRVINGGLMVNSCSYLFEELDIGQEYSVSAFIDLNMNARCDIFESLGACMDNPINLSSCIIFTNADIIITDKNVDEDALPDWYEKRIIDANENDEIVSITDVEGDDDFDVDGLTNAEEYDLGTSPLMWDTDADKVGDGVEVTIGNDPLSFDEYVDTDEDGLIDYNEIHIYYTDPLIADSDADGMPDGWEVMYGLDPLVNDADDDTDGDGALNVFEFQNGSSPMDITDRPDNVGYWIVDLGTLGGGYSKAFDINNTHQVVGESTDAQGVTNAFVYDQSGILKIRKGTAVGINNLGDIIINDAGSCYIKRSDTLQKLSVNNAQCLDINDNGTVVGYSIYDRIYSISGEYFRPSQYVSFIVNGAQTSIMAYEGRSHVIEYDRWFGSSGIFMGRMLTSLNDREVIAGYDLYGPYSQAYLYTVTPFYFNTDLIEHIMPVEYSEVNAVNNNNICAGYDYMSYLVKFAHDWTVMIYDINSGERFEIAAAEDIPYTCNNEAVDINDANDVVGHINKSVFVSSEDQWRVGTYTLLHEELCSEQQQDFTLIDAGAIADTGAIAGSARGRDREIHAVMVVREYDHDGDGMWDHWERKSSLNPYNAGDSALDSDGDGLNNLEEFRKGTDPQVVDTDGDGLSDYQEVIVYGTKPRVIDTDKDDVVDGDEAEEGTDPLIFESRIDGLVGYWPLDEGAGLIAGNINGSGNDGRLIGPPEWVDGKEEKALMFNGSNDRLVINGLPVNTNSGGCNTVTFWMYWNGSYNEMPFAWGGADYALYFLNHAFGFNTGQGNVFGISAEGLEQHWVHVAAVFYNGVPSSSTVKLYIGGSRQVLADRLTGVTTLSRSASSNAYISMRDVGISYEYRGIIDDVRIYNRELTAVEVISIMTGVRLETDSDNDGIPDDIEVFLGTDPENPDTDGDELTDGEEFNVYGTDPIETDTDNDALLDSDEVLHETDPNNSDTDGDGLFDGEEVLLGTNPLSADTDSDGMPDDWEVMNGLDPNQDDSKEDKDGDNLTMERNMN